MIRVQVHQIYLGTRMGDRWLNKKLVTSGYKDQFNVNWVKNETFVTMLANFGSLWFGTQKFDEVQISD